MRVLVKAAQEPWEVPEPTEPWVCELAESTQPKPTYLVAEVSESVTGRSLLLIAVLLVLELVPNPGLLELDTPLVVIGIDELLSPILAEL